MLGKSRKKQDDNYKKGEQNALPSFDTSKLDKDKYIVKDLGVNKESKKQLNGISIKKIAVAIFLLVVILTIIFVLKFINFNVTEMIWKVNVTRGSENINNKSVKYSLFKNGLMRISNDGITYINNFGEVVYTISYNMKDPIFKSNNNYFAIADRNAYEFYVFDGEGITSHSTVKNPIQKISLSIDGIIYILQSDEENSYINLFRSNGEEIDIVIKTTLIDDGMPIDISTSDDGTKLLVTYVCLSNSDIYSKATYYSFDDYGERVSSKRIVGEFVDELNDKFLARSHYFDNNKSCLLYDKGVYFVSLNNNANPNIIGKYEFDDKIRSISYNDNYIVFVFEDNSMKIYSKDAMLMADNKIDINYENFYISDNYVIFIYGRKVVIYDTRGRMIFDKEMEMDIQYVAKKKSLIFTELLLGLIDGVECIRFY